MCSGAVSGAEMKMSRFVCEPSGAFTIVASLWFVLFVSTRAAVVPPEARCRSPGAARGAGRGGTG